MAPLRDNVMQLFFKRLTSHDEELVEAARAGLAAVVAHQRMPKLLLQVVHFDDVFIACPIDSQACKICVFLNHITTGMRWCTHLTLKIVAPACNCFALFILAKCQSPVLKALLTSPVPTCRRACGRCWPTWRSTTSWT